MPQQPFVLLPGCKSVFKRPRCQCLPRGGQVLSNGFATNSHWSGLIMFAIWGSTLTAMLVCMLRTRLYIARCGQLGHFCRSSSGSCTVLLRLDCCYGCTRLVFSLLLYMVRGLGVHTGSRCPRAISVSCCLDGFLFAHVEADCRRPLHCSHTHLAVGVTRQNP
jgi:hypothetical protein